jgi:hypothetical protein
MVLVKRALSSGLPPLTMIHMGSSGFELTFHGWANHPVPTMDENQIAEDAREG